MSDGKSEAMEAMRSEDAFRRNRMKDAERQGSPEWYVKETASALVRFRDTGSTCALRDARNWIGNATRELGRLMDEYGA